MVGVEPSPQFRETVLVSCRPGLTIVAADVTAPPSTMLVDDNTRPGDTKATAGLLMPTSSARTRSRRRCRSRSRQSLRPRGRVGCVVVRGGEGVRPGREVEDSRGRPITPIDRGGEVCQGLASMNVPLKITESLGAA